MHYQRIRANEFWLPVWRTIVHAWDQSIHKIKSFKIKVLETPFHACKQYINPWIPESTCWFSFFLSFFLKLASACNHKQHQYRYILITITSYLIRASRFLTSERFSCFASVFFLRTIWAVRFVFLEAISPRNETHNLYRSLFISACCKRCFAVLGWGLLFKPIFFFSFGGLIAYKGGIILQCNNNCNPKHITSYKPCHIIFFLHPE